MSAETLAALAVALGAGWHSGRHRTWKQRSFG
jgi:hypothetical protein